MQFFYTVRTGDPGWIAYTSNQGGSYDIWLYRPFDGIHIQLTRNLGAEFSIPYWSNDSRKIAFIGKQGIVYVVDITTGFVTHIDQILPNTLLDWSPDNQTLSYVNQNQIVHYQTATHRFRSLPYPGATDVQWFPSGNELLFQAPDAAGVSQLYRMNSDGTNKRQVTRNTGGPLHDVRLSPDGSFALFTSPGASISIISTVNLATGQTYTLEGGPLAKNFFPAWAPDSTRISYSATAFGPVYYSLIETDSRTGGKRRTLALSSCYATPVTWSPTGEKMVYLSGCTNETSSNQIWLVDIRNPIPILLVSGGNITAVQWSPSPSNPTQTNREKKQSISVNPPSSELRAELNHQAALIRRYPHLTPS